MGLRAKREEKLQQSATQPSGRSQLADQLGQFQRRLLLLLLLMLLLLLLLMLPGCHLSFEQSNGDNEA